MKKIFIIVVSILLGLIIIFAVANFWFNKDNGMMNMDSMDMPNKTLYEMQIISEIDNLKPNQTTKIIYKINNEKGLTLKDFDIAHEKIMHFIVIRKDLKYFQHIHPEFDKVTGEFSIDLIFPADGEYRLFSDFIREPLLTTIFQDIKVGNLVNYKPQPIGSLERNKAFATYGYTIAMSSATELLTPQNDIIFSFNIEKFDKPIIDLEKYLGALGHTIVLRENDLQFIHAHNLQEAKAIQNGKVDFMVRFPKSGNYKLFSQFQHQGKIMTSDFVVNVKEK